MVNYNYACSRCDLPGHWAHTCKATYCKDCDRFFNTLDNDLETNQIVLEKHLETHIFSKLPCPSCVAAHPFPTRDKCQQMPVVGLVQHVEHGTCFGCNNGEDPRKIIFNFCVSHGLSSYLAEQNTNEILPENIEKQINTNIRPANTRNYSKVSGGIPGGAPYKCRYCSDSAFDILNKKNGTNEVSGTQAKLTAHSSRRTLGKTRFFRQLSECLRHEFNEHEKLPLSTAQQKQLLSRCPPADAEKKYFETAEEVIERLGGRKDPVAESGHAQDDGAPDNQ